MDIAEKTLQLKQDFDDVFEAGKTKEWSDFWDIVQNKGSRTDYSVAFCGGGWNTKTFIPKYDIKPTTAERMFYLFGQSSGGLSLIKHLKDININLDFSNCKRFYYAFYGIFSTSLPTIDLSKSTVANHYCFASNILTTIEKLIFSEETETNYLFADATGLANIRSVEGSIGKSISFSVCPLTKASIENVVNALSGTTTALTCTFKKTAKENAFTTDEWNTLIATKPNWTFSLV